MILFFLFTIRIFLLVDETEKSFILLFYNKMARPARFDAASGTEFVTLGTYEDVTKKLN
jgi:hypothetical protein